MGLTKYDFSYSAQAQGTRLTNNDIFRRLRFIFDYSDRQMMAIFALADLEVSRQQVSAWLKKEEQEGFEKCRDIQLATFLNGLINHRRGKKDGPQVEPENRLNNNIIFRKLKIAMNFQDDDVIEVMGLANLRISKPELSSFFRKAGHRNYRECENQILRNFLQGLQIKFRPDVAASPKAKAKPVRETSPSEKPTRKNFKKSQDPKNKSQHNVSLKRTDTKSSDTKTTAKNKASDKSAANKEPREKLGFSWSKKGK